MRYVLVLLAGVILGGLLALYFVVGAPGAKRPPGSTVKAPEPGGDAPGTVLVTLDEKFFDALLGSIFRDIGPPTFHLSMGERTPDGAANLRYAVLQNGCTNSVTIAAEDSNAKTGVRFTNGKIMAPLAFSGSYNLPVAGCMQFKGWAQANIELRFDQDKQTVYGQINVEGVNLDNMSPLLSGPITVFVQNAIDQRVNPLEFLRAQQLALAVPVQASGGTLKAQVKDVRAEVKDNALQMHITYDFKGERGQQSAPPQS